MPVERVAPPPPLLPGDPAPWLKADSIGDRPGYVLQNAAGRFLLLALIDSSTSPTGAAMLALAEAHGARFDGLERAFFAITADPADADRLRPALPGRRYLLDPQGEALRRFGTIVEKPGEPARFRPMWLVLDPMFRIHARFAPQDGEAAIACLAQARIVADGPVPVLAVPHVFEPALCADLIAGYAADGGMPSGFMRDIDGQTRELADPRHKQRSDWNIADETLRRGISARINRRLVPEIAKAFQFHATRIERHIVARYDAEEGGYFRPHRDNTSFGTAHRRFAITINLNAEDYDGGDLRFAEYSPRPWRATTGGAIVFSCSMLHEAMPVTRGTRYAYLSFLYDDAAARVREENNSRLGAEVGAYRAA